MPSLLQEQKATGMCEGCPVGSSSRSPDLMPFVSSSIAERGLMCKMRVGVPDHFAFLLFPPSLMFLSASPHMRPLGLTINAYCAYISRDVKRRRERERERHRGGG